MNPNDPGRPQMAMALMGSMVMLACLVIALGLLMGLDGNEFLLHALAVTVVALGTIPLILDVGRPAETRQIMLSLMSLSYGIYFAVPVWSQFFAEGGAVDYSGVILLKAPDFIKAEVGVLVGLLCLYAGYFLPFGKMASGIMPRYKHDWSQNIAIRTALIIIPLGTLVWFGSAVGLIPPRLGSGVLGVINRGTFIGIALLSILYFGYGNRTARNIMLVAVPATMMVYLFTGMKIKLLMAPLYAVLGLIIIERKIRLRWVLAGMATLTILYPASEIFRSTIRGQTALQVMANPAPAFRRVFYGTSQYEPLEYVTAGFLAALNRTDALTMTAVIMHDTPSRIPYQGGWSIGYIPLTYVPRAIWANKPVFDIGQFATDVYGPPTYIRSSTGVSWVGELYMNFGPLGIVTGMAIMGFLIRVLHETLFTNVSTIPGLLACAAVLFQIARNVGGFLIAPINGVIFDLAFLYAAHLMVRVLDTKNNLTPRRLTEAQGDHASR